MPSVSQMEREDDSDGEDVEMDFDSLVNSVVLYILGIDDNCLPVKRADIVKHALPKNGRKFMSVIMEVKKILDSTYGLNLMDLDGTNKLYLPLCNNKLVANSLPASSEHRRKKTLLLIILSYIFMVDDSVTEDQLWNYLKQLKLVESSENYEHPEFGNVRRLCNIDFVRQMYLKTEKIPQTNPPEVLFSWGLRAHAEFDKLEILKFVGKMQGNIDPEKFSSHWAKVQEEKQQNGDDSMVVENSQPQAPVKSSQRRSSHRSR